MRETARSRFAISSISASLPEKRGNDATLGVPAGEQKLQRPDDGYQLGIVAERSRKAEQIGKIAFGYAGLL
jgi:hypothetical protein